MTVDPAVLEDTEYEPEVDAEEDLEALAESLGLDFDFEERPLSQRGGQGRPRKAEIPWEEMLASCREHPDADMRIRIFDPKQVEKAESKAKALAREIRQRLFTHVPLEQWDVSHRHYPTDGTYRVYAKFVKVLTKKESDERIQKAKDQSARLQEARAKNKAMSEANSK